MGGASTGDFDFGSWLDEPRADPTSPDVDALDPTGVNARLAELAAKARIEQLAEQARGGTAPTPPVATPPASVPPVTTPPAEQPNVAGAAPTNPAAPAGPAPNQRPPSRQRPVPGAAGHMVSSDTPIVGDVNTLWANLPSSSQTRKAAPPTDRRDADPKGGRKPLRRRAAPQQAAPPGATQPRPAARQTAAGPPVARQKAAPRRATQSRSATAQPQRPAGQQPAVRRPAGQGRPAPQSTNRRPENRPNEGVDIPLVVGAVIFVVGIAALAAWWAFDRTVVPDTASTIDGVSLNVTRCDADSATAVAVNGGPEAREFDATVTFTADGSQLFPVVVPLELASGAQQTLRIPFNGNIDPGVTLGCTGALSNVRASG